jgi:serine/threonine-protein kinase HipA
MPEVDVIVQIGGEDALAGRLWSHRRRGRESATFSYSEGYLARGDAYALDPLLPLVAGPQQTPARRPIFGAFSDCAPDRWGRRLIQRAERRRARREDEAERSFGEVDYLLGVRDDLRQGTLRFRDVESGAYLAGEREGVPDLLELPGLLGAAERMERDEASEEELRRLLRGGSSLGGARPKAHVLDRQGRLAIAKFPSPADDWDVMRWEAVALALARDAGISVPESALHEIDGKAVLIVDRFDRRGEIRIGYVSAMTMLEASDGEQGSYLDIAEAIELDSADAGEELRQLWRRVAFSILISNTDDHLRNHGFLRTSTAGWSLSPAFDLNPDPQTGPKRLSTSIDYDTDAARLDVLMGVAEYFRLGELDARRVLSEVLAAAGEWRSAARAAGLGRVEIERMAPAFEHDQAEAARALAPDQPV